MSETHFEHDGRLFIRHVTAAGLTTFKEYIAPSEPHVPDEVVRDLESLLVWCDLVENIVPDAVGKLLIRADGSIDALMPFHPQPDIPQWWASMNPVEPVTDIGAHTEAIRATIASRGGIARHRWLLLASPSKETA